MDVDVMKNLSENDNGTFDPDMLFYYHRSYALDILVALSGAISLIASIFTIYVIRRYEILHTRTNIYLGNLCLSYVLYLLFTPIFLNLFALSERVLADEICIVNESLMLLLLAMFVFACVLLADWYIVNYRSYNISARCRTSYVFVSFTVWLVLISLFSTVCIQCISGISEFPTITVITGLVFLLSFIFVLFVHLIRCMNCRVSATTTSDLELTLVTYYFACWCPNLVCMLLHIYEGFGSDKLELITFAIGNFYPCVALYKMYRKDENFNNCCNILMGNENVEFHDAYNIVVEQSRSSKEQFTVLI